MGKCRCGKLLTKRQKRFCSVGCAEAAKRKDNHKPNHRMKLRLCPHCGQKRLFEVRLTYCSKDCADAAKRGDPKGGEVRVEQGFSDSGNTWSLDIRGSRISTLEEVLESFKVDETIWEVKEFRITRQEAFAMPRAVGSDDDGWRRLSGKPLVVPLNHIRALFRRKVEVIRYREEIESLIQWGKRIAPKRRLARSRPTNSGNLLELDIPDIHLAGLVWGKETGFADWDLGLAKKHVTCAAESLIQQASAHRFEKVLYVVGNDFLQVDNLDNSTARGTRQDMDTRYQKAYRDGLHLVIQTVERLLEVAPVDVMVVPGNHDWLTMMTMAVALEIQFSRSKHVNVIDALPTRKVYQWGRTLLGYTHGDKEARGQSKLKTLPGLFAANFPVEHGSTEFREVHVGHWHSVLFAELHGWIVRGLSALCPASAWAANAGFIGSQRRADSFYWSKDYGNLGTGAYVIPN